MKTIFFKFKYKTNTILRQYRPRRFAGMSLDNSKLELAKKTFDFGKYTALIKNLDALLEKPGTSRRKLVFCDTSERDVKIISVVPYSHLRLHSLKRQKSIS